MKKQKTLTVLAIIAGVLIGLIIIGRLTGGLQSFNVPTGANAPTIAVGDRIYSSNLVKPERFDFICYHYTDSLKGREMRVYRLCGLPGDTVEIRNGDLYVNALPVDHRFTLGLPYEIPDSSVIAVTELFKLEEYDVYGKGTGMATVYLSSKQCGELSASGIPFKRTRLPKDHVNEYISYVFKQPWNQDHFGPLVVPADHYFVLGDNRHRAQDSRYIGFIPQKDYYGTVLGLK